MAAVFKSKLTGIDEIQKQRDLMRKMKAKLAAKIGKAAEDWVKDFHKFPLEDVVGPFEHDFRVVTKRKLSGDKVTFITDIMNDPVETPLGTETDLNEIFYYLNNGTSERFAQMPSTFTPESSPGSLATRSAGYDRNQIGFSEESLDGIQARNFIEQIANLQSAKTAFKTRVANLQNLINEL